MTGEEAAKEIEQIKKDPLGFIKSVNEDYFSGKREMRPHVLIVPLHVYEKLKEDRNEDK